MARGVCRRLLSVVVVCRRRLSQHFEDFLAFPDTNFLDMFLVSLIACENCFQKFKRSRGVAARAINVKIG